MRAMKQVDRQALELAMEQARREPDIAAQLDDKLQGTKLEDGQGLGMQAGVLAGRR
jgi:hypothetical protein